MTTPAKSAPKPRNVPPGKPPKGYRWLKRGEVVDENAGCCVWNTRMANFMTNARSYHWHVVGSMHNDLKGFPFVCPIGATLSIARATPAKTKRKSVPVRRTALKYYLRRKSQRSACGFSDHDVIAAFIAGARYAQRSARAEKGAK
jgi:hypothetical protein